MQAGAQVSTRTGKDWILWGALGCALVATAHAEYTLAIEAHFNKYVALAVPGALDLYVIRALQERRDVFVAVLAMVAANVASHLIVAGVLPVGWPVVSAVGAVAPLVVWRVYSLKYTRTRQELLWGLEAGTGPEDAGAVSAPGGDDHAPARTCPECGDLWDQVHENWSDDPADPCPVKAHPVEDDPIRYFDPICGRSPQPGARLTDPCPDCTHLWAVHRTPQVPAVPDHVPGDWMDEEYPETHPSAPAPVSYLPQRVHLEAVPDLKPLPDLPDEYAAGAVHSDVLKDSDYEFLGKATRYLDDVANPTVRGMKTALGIGQERAERLLAHLGVRP